MQLSRDHLYPSRNSYCPVVGSKRPEKHGSSRQPFLQSVIVVLASDALRTSGSALWLVTVSLSLCGKSFSTSAYWLHLVRLGSNGNTVSPSINLVSIGASGGMPKLMCKCFGQDCHFRLPAPLFHFSREQTFGILS